jgi:hypothetical protein
MGKAFKIEEQVEIFKKASSNFQAIEPLDLHKEKPVHSLHVSLLDKRFPFPSIRTQS